MRRLLSNTVCILEPLIVNNLVFIGEYVLERDLVLYALGELDSLYNAFVSYMTIIMCKDKIMFKDFASHLMSYRRRLITQRGLTRSLNQMQANVTRFNPRQQGTGSKSYNVPKNYSFKWNIHDFL